jgi:hypothetical protein
MNRRIALAAVGAVAVAAVALLLRRADPAVAWFYPPCPFHEWTGLYCAGCGSLRAFHALLNGDLARAWSHNPVVTSCVPLLAIGVAREGVRWIRGADPVAWRLPSWSIWTFVGLLGGFMVLRNVPFFAWLAP